MIPIKITKDPKKRLNGPGKNIKHLICKSTDPLKSINIPDLVKFVVFCGLFDIY
jgi:hypothetical protein